MTGEQAQLEAHALNQILEVTRKLAAPFDLDTMLSEVVDAARTILDADRGTVSKQTSKGAPRLDPLIVEASGEVDRGLLRWMRSLSPRARLRRSPSEP